MTGTHNGNASPAATKYYRDYGMRARELRNTGPKIGGVVTACPGRMINLIDNVLHNKMPQKVYHLLELVE